MVIHEPEQNLFDELLEITKIRIATLEGCPDEWINWINKELPYDN